MQGMFHGMREYLTPVLSESSFLTKGLLTPEEFVQAGDQLIYKCPTWRWAAGDPSKTRSILPPTKQYLITRNVPCRCRVDALDAQYKKEVEIQEHEEEGNILDDGHTWLATHALHPRDSREDECIGDMISESIEPQRNPHSINILGAMVDSHFDPSDEPGLTYEEASLDADAATLPTYLTAEEPDENENAILRTRTYDLSMTYDKYYQTPRVWLFGYEENGQPLTTEEIFQDIMQDYAQRTVTIEIHPHHDVPHASIHPCQHAAVMKRIVDNLSSSKTHARVDQYLFIFLKFIQSVVPTIDYDHTMEIQAK